MNRLTGRMLQTEWWRRRVKLWNFLATEIFTLSDRLQEVWYNSQEVFKKAYIVFSTTGLPQGFLVIDVGLRLYGLALDHVREEAVLVLMLYSDNKTRLLNIHCTGYEYSKDSLVLYLNISCFDLTVTLPNKKYNNNKKKKIEKSGMWFLSKFLGDPYYEPLSQFMIMVINEVIPLQSCRIRCVYKTPFHKFGHIRIKLQIIRYIVQ